MKLYVWLLYASCSFLNVNRCLSVLHTKRLQHEWNDTKYTHTHKNVHIHIRTHCDTLWKMPRRELTHARTHTYIYIYYSGRTLRPFRRHEKRTRINWKEDKTGKIQTYVYIHARARTQHITCHRIFYDDHEVFRLICSFDARVRMREFVCVCVFWCVFVLFWSAFISLWPLKKRRWYDFHLHSYRPDIRSFVLIIPEFW